jgi:acetyl-CoA carboxylase biotin carboxyl carrier protein
VDIRKVKKLIELLEESGISELEIKEGEESVRISRHSPATSTPFSLHMQNAAPAMAAAPAIAHEEKAPKSADNLPAGHRIESPMVGTYYEAAAPGAGPFVQIGQRVKVGDTLCIIEAMKILNQIESDVAGEVKAILAKNGDPIEYGQALFIIE